MGNRGTSAVRATDNATAAMQFFSDGFGVEQQRSRQGLETPDVTNRILDQKELGGKPGDLFVVVNGNEDYFKHHPLAEKVDDGYLFRRLPETGWNVKEALSFSENEQGKEGLRECWDQIQKRARFKFSDGRSRVFRVEFPGGPRKGKKWVALNKDGSVTGGNIHYHNDRPTESTDAYLTHEDDQWKFTRYKFPADHDNLHSVAEEVHRMNMMSPDAYTIADSLDKHTHEAMGYTLQIDDPRARAEIAKDIKDFQKYVQSVDAFAIADDPIVKEKVQTKLEFIDDNLSIRMYGTAGHERGIFNRIRGFDSISHLGFDTFKNRTEEQVRGEIKKAIQESMRLVKRMPDKKQRTSLTRKMKAWEKYIDDGEPIHSETHNRMIKGIINGLDLSN